MVFAFCFLPFCPLPSIFLPSADEILMNRVGGLPAGSHGQNNSGGPGHDIATGPKSPLAREVIAMRGERPTKLVVVARTQARHRDRPELTIT